MKYKNNRAAEEDAELEALEAEYRKTYGREPGDPILGNEQPLAVEETPEPVLDKEEETWKQRYANLKSYSDKNRNEDAKARKALEDRIALLEKKPVDLPSNKEEAREWVSKYPDLAAVIKSLIREDVEYLKEELGPQLQELETTKNEIAMQKAFNTVVKAHPDFPELLNSPEFTEWVDRQPEEKGKIGQAIYDSLHSLDAHAAIKAVEVYKREVSPKPKKDTAREVVQSVSRTSNGTPRQDGKVTYSESQIEKMSMREYEMNEEAIDIAKRENRFIYDISGAAR
jgi:methyl-accepting chemotaxis protein